MQAIIAMLIAAVPQAILAIASKLLTQDLLQAVLQRVIIQTLTYAASLTTNTIDDEIVADIANRLKAAK